MKTILVIDDEEFVAKMLAKLLTRAGYKVFVALNGTDGISIFEREPIDLVITDIIMPDKEGFEIIFKLKSVEPDCKIIAISGGGRINPATYLSTAKEIGAIKTFTKPFDLKELVSHVNELLDQNAEV